MPPPSPPPLPAPHVPARGRPAADPACAGCAQLGVFHALRRAGLDVQGGPGCDPAAPRTFEASPGRWAAVAGARGVVADARAVLGAAAAAGARLVVVADRCTGEARALGAALAAAGARASPRRPRRPRRGGGRGPGSRRVARRRARRALRVPAGHARVGAVRDRAVALQPLRRVPRPRVPGDLGPRRRGDGHRRRDLHRLRALRAALPRARDRPLRGRAVTAASAASRTSTAARPPRRVP